MSYNTNDPKATQTIWVFRGRHFNRGVLSALRAYPQVIALEHLTIDEGQYLLLALNFCSHDSSPFARAIISAGGEIESVQRAAQTSLQSVSLAIAEGRGIQGADGAGS